ncbi:peptide/nickel transport system permease protein [Halobacillus alkaliphilus]|uniref:Peptide/nickel transport system permease protein n=1 Tax=Halobacillus alkaliphilus TaxID=396056 RepID=A0A1I2L7Y2_9BACI|nr:ABC transporter permease subunit [Halobacillus alkaliphilus]SFF75434.1 peptide/nickel transport system permease protein [Halobacillus alkaliphilus]
MKIIKFMIYYITGLAGILFISASPALFREGSFFDIFNYFSELQQLVAAIFNPSEWVYVYKDRPEPLLEFLWEPYQYSMMVFVGGLLLGFVLAFLLALGTMFLPGWIKWIIGRILNILEAVPDLLLAFCLQLFIVWFYKQTDIQIVSFTALRQEKVYILPMIAIAVLPLVTMYKIILMLMDEEMTKSYVQMAKSKGLEKAVILNVHVIRNIVKSIFFHSKIILWGSLSSLLIIEYIFNMNGITSFFIEDFRPIVSAMILFMIFTPFFIIYQGTELFIFKDHKISKETSLSMNRFIGDFNINNPGGKWLKQTFATIGAHFKNRKFLIGFIVISGTVCVSVVYSITADPLVDKFYHITNEEGRLVSAAPHSPEYVFLGTDALGYSIFDQLLAGAKYTILFALVIAFLRMSIGFLFAIPYTFFLPSRIQRGVEKLVDGMHFLPMTIIAFLLLTPVLRMPPGGFTTTQTERIIYQGVILVLLAVPLIVTLLGSEMKLLMQEEYAVSAKVLGGSSLHLLRKHLLPHLSARMGIVFGQQFIQTLLIFIHLGVFNIYFGGTNLDYSPMQADPPTSTTYEWSGLIGAAKDSIMTGRWWFIIPALLCFMGIILSMQLIIQGIKEVQHKRVGVPVSNPMGWKKFFRKSKPASRQAGDPSDESFVFINSEHRSSEKAIKGVIKGK